MRTPKAICSSLQAFIGTLMEDGVVIEFPGLVTQIGLRSLLTFQRSDDCRRSDILGPCISEFESCSELAAYTCKFRDESFAQVHVEWVESVVVSSRFVYYPSQTYGPYRAEALLRRFGEGHVAVEDVLWSLRCASPLRFEYDPAAAREGHAASHCHLNTFECRIPIERRLTIARFFELIILEFYPEASRRLEYLRQHLDGSGDVVTDQSELARVHISG